MSWTGNNADAILQAHLNLDYNGSPEAAVGVVSAYYSGVTTKGKLWICSPWRLDHLFWAVLWRRKAMYYAETITETFLSRIDGRFSEMLPTANDVDVLCAVFWRLGKQPHKMAALRLLRYISTSINLKTIQLHTMAFIALHRVRYGLDAWNEDVHARVQKTAETIALMATDAKPAQKQSDYGQVSRIYRQLAEMLPSDDVRRAQHMSLAKFYAVAAGATDQVLKAG